jgi:hypothetical protein
MSDDALLSNAYELSPSSMNVPGCCLGICGRVVKSGQSMNDRTETTPKKRWVAPVLEQLSMVDTASKPGGNNEGSPLGMPMVTGNSTLS